MNKITKRVTTALLVALAFLFMLLGCSERFGPGTDQPADQTELSIYQGALAKGDLNLANELRLKYFAKALARALNEPGVGAYMKNEIGKKFDGDYDVLWASVKDRDFPNVGRMRGMLAAALQGMNSIVSLDEIEEVPLLQIALPVGFEKWDGKAAIKVAYTPLTTNDVDVQEISAYDSSGEEYILDGQEPPDFPVMVVGINERGGNDLVHSPSTTSTALMKRAGKGNYQEVYIQKIYLNWHPRNYEPWYLGKADLYFIMENMDWPGPDGDGERYYDPHKDHKVTVWKLTWRGWIATYKKWRSVGCYTDMTAATEGGNYNSSKIYIIELDGLGKDNDPFSDHWYEIDDDYIDTATSFGDVFYLPNSASSYIEQWGIHSHAKLRLSYIIEPD